MRRLFPFCFCLFLGLVAMIQAEPVTKPRSAPAASAAHNGAGRVTVTLVPRPANPLPEYLLTPPVPPGGGPIWRAAQEDTLREAALRYLFKSARKDHRISTYYISVRGKDPSAAFLRQFRGNQPPVRGISARPAATGDWTTFFILPLKWVNNTHVEVSTAEACSGGSEVTGLTCVLRKRRWEIQRTVSVSG